MKHFPVHDIFRTGAFTKYMRGEIGVTIERTRMRVFVKAEEKERRRRWEKRWWKKHAKHGFDMMGPPPYEFDRDSDPEGDIEVSDGEVGSEYWS